MAEPSNQDVVQYLEDLVDTVNATAEAHNNTVQRADGAFLLLSTALIEVLRLLSVASKNERQKARFADLASQLTAEFHRRKEPQLPDSPG